MAAAVATAFGLPAYSQVAAAASPAALADVVVTAERVGTLARETPVSVGVIGQDVIESRGLYRLQDLAGSVAGVTVPNGDSNMPQAVGIRGVGVSIPAMSQAVGLYLDDVPLLRGYAVALWDLPDIERVEVLKGPQGTLYGQNTTAGAVKYVSMDPTASRSGWASASVGNYGTKEARAYATGAIGDGPLSASLAASERRNDGFATNATLHERINRTDATQFRAKLRMAPDASDNIVIAVDGLRDRSDLNTLNYPLNAPNSAPRVSYTAVDSGAFKTDSGGLSLKVEHMISQQIQLRSITSYRAYRIDPMQADIGGLSVQHFAFDQKVRQNAFSQEFQLNGRQSGITWTAGATITRDRFDFDRYSTSLPLGAPTAFYNQATTHLETTDLGLYGQAHYSLSTSTAVTLGLRAFRTRQTGQNDFWTTNAAQTKTSTIYAVGDLSTSETGVSPRIGIDHRWSTDLFSYANIAQGEKFGGFNRAAQSLASARHPANPEKVTTYEAGSKGRFLAGRVSAAMAVFYNDYRDYLASLTNQIVEGVLVTDSVLVNAGKAKTFGVDLDLAANLDADTSATLSTEWLRTRFDTFTQAKGTAGGNVVGNQLPYAPRVTVGLGVSHVERFTSGAEFKADLSVQHLHAQFADVQNTQALKVPAQTYVNLGGTWYLPANHWSVSVRVRNVFDKSYILIRDSIPALGVDSAAYSPPRTLLLAVRYDL